MPENFEIESGFIAEQNASNATAHAEDFDYLGRKLGRRNLRGGRWQGLAGGWQDERGAGRGNVFLGSLAWDEADAARGRHRDGQHRSGSISGLLVKRLIE